jgi:PleD family two-component response regulator
MNPQPANASDKLKILIVDDQEAKLLSLEAILDGIGETLIKASTAREVFDCLLNNEIALILMDVCMPDLDGFELAEMIRDHPRFQRMTIIFISAAATPIWTNFAAMNSAQSTTCRYRGWAKSAAG